MIYYIELFTFLIPWVVSILLIIVYFALSGRRERAYKEKHNTDRDFWWLDMLQDHFRWIEQSHKKFGTGHWGRVRSYNSMLDQVRIMEDKIDNVIKRHYNKQDRKFKEEIKEETKNE